MFCFVLKFAFACTFTECSGQDIRQWWLLAEKKELWEGGACDRIAWPPYLSDSPLVSVLSLTNSLGGGDGNILKGEILFWFTDGGYSAPYGGGMATTTAQALTAGA